MKNKITILIMSFVFITLFSVLIPESFAVYYYKDSSVENCLENGVKCSAVKAAKFCNSDNAPFDCFNQICKKEHPYPSEGRANCKAQLKWGDAVCSFPNNIVVDQQANCCKVEKTILGSIYGVMDENCAQQEACPLNLDDWASRGPGTTLRNIENSDCHQEKGMWEGKQNVYFIESMPYGCTLNQDQWDELTKNAPIKEKTCNIIDCPNGGNPDAIYPLDDGSCSICPPDKQEINGQCAPLDYTVCDGNPCKHSVREDESYNCGDEAPDDIGNPSGWFCCTSDNIPPPDDPDTEGVNEGDPIDGCYPNAWCNRKCKNVNPIPPEENEEEEEQTMPPGNPLGGNKDECPYTRWFSGVVCKIMGY